MGFNTPLPLTLRDECKKAAKIVRSFIDVNNNGLDKVIPRSVLEKAHGFAIFTVAKAGFLVSARAGSGLVIARLDDGSWSPPSALAVGGMGFGGQVGAEVTDFMIVLNSRSAVASFMSAGSFTLGGNLSVAVGPLGRNAEASGAVNTKAQLAAMYSYSKTRGLFGGVSVEGSVIAERQDANRIAYGGNPTAKQILTGAFNPPDWAYLLIDVLADATTRPGMENWVQDHPDDAQAMGTGWNGGRNNEKKGSGYAFGEGVGAGGTSPAGRRGRSGSLMSLGYKDKDRSPGQHEAVFSSNGRWVDPRVEDPYDDNPWNGRRSSPRGSGNVTPVTDTRPPPSRPWEARRASSYLPFSNSPKKNERITGPSSETYNADPTATRSRASSVVSRPYEQKATPSPFADLGSRARSGSTPVRGSTPARGSPDLIGDWDGQRQQSPARSERSQNDLLGQWETGTNGVTASFARLNTGSPARQPNRSRANSSLQNSVVPENGRGNWASARGDWEAPYEVPDDPVAAAKRQERNRRVSNQAPSRYSDAEDPFNDDPPSSRDYSPPRRPANSRKHSAADEGYARAVALFDFRGRESGDLSFSKGQIIVVLGSVDSEWWTGRHPGTSAEGIFPGSYIEVLEIPRTLKSNMTKSLLKSRVLGLDDFD
ncbi:hypothetical protein Q8F55_007002 [Vanrija albida]|uniref:SH3 domain-containing protein n=1 Tax=Vanrija albida TaxID=181172 RepID=A0ABR3PYQ1_9TREE